MKIVGIMQFYNEEDNLTRSLQSMKKFCDDLVLYNDGSTDSSIEVAKTFTDNIINCEKRDWINEIKHKNQLLEKALELKPDWIFWLDADEIIAENANIKYLCEIGSKTGLDAWEFHEVNLWKNKSWYRIDNQFGGGWFVRLWRNNGNLRFNNTLPGFHQKQHPDGIIKIALSNYKIIHYGFDTDEKIAKKIREYLMHGMTIDDFRRFIDESNLDFLKASPEWFPKETYKEDKKPEQMTEDLWLKKIHSL
jgi:glycosyltransferase involved in cell wall biosynthesis